MNPGLTELIARAPWREAVTYRDSWPHEYVLSQKDDQRPLLAAVCARFRAGEGVTGRFFGMNNTYLFIGDYKYWLMSDFATIDPWHDKTDYVLNRAPLYRDRRDFVIQPGDSGRRGPTGCWHKTGRTGVAPIACRRAGGGGTPDSASLIRHAANA